MCRTLLVSGGAVAGAAPGPCPHANGDFNPANGSTAVQLIPFANTPSPGGEYKVWLIPVDSATIDPGNDKALIFPGGNKKTDNFKVDESLQCPVQDPECECPEGGCDDPTENEITGTKFYDANVNGIQDGDEAGIPGWFIQASIPSNTTTDANGNYSFLDVPDGDVRRVRGDPVLGADVDSDHRDIGVR